MAFTSFPIETKKFTELVETTSIDGTEQLAVVDGGVSNRVTVDNLLDPFKADNVVIVKQESDFGTAVGGVIELQDNTIYEIGVSQIVMTNRLSFTTPLGKVMVRGGNIAIAELIYLGTDTFITASNYQTIEFRNCSITGATGTATLHDLTGLGKLVRSEVYYRNFTVTNFAQAGTIRNSLLLNLSNFYAFQCAGWVVDDCFLFTANICGFQSFGPTNKPILDFRTNLDQANISICSFVPYRGDSAISISPAITPTSGVSIGPGVPYQGFTFVAIASFSDAGGGNTRVNLTSPPYNNPFANGELVNILDSSNYGGFHAVSNVTNTTFDIPVAFTTDDANPNSSLALLISGGTANTIPFFTPGVSGSITAIADNGSGNARFTSAAHGRSNGEALFIDETQDYNGGGYVIVIDVNNFDLLDPFGQPVPFVGIESSGTWDTSSLDQTNNVVTTANTGGIIPDSQTLGNTILTSTVAFASTTTLTRVSTGTWFSDEAERFKVTSDGRLIYIGRTTATVSISAKAVAQKQGGSTSTAFMNIMEKRMGAGSFTEIANHPSSQTLITSSDSAQLTIAAIVDKVNPGDEFGIGVASDTSFTMDIFSIDFNIKK